MTVTPQQVEEKNPEIFSKDTLQIYIDKIDRVLLAGELVVYLAHIPRKYREEIVKKYVEVGWGINWKYDAEASQEYWIFSKWN